MGGFVTPLFLLAMLPQDVALITFPYPCISTLLLLTMIIVMDDLEVSHFHTLIHLGRYHDRKRKKK